MIIKSLARKTPSFDHLTEYICDPASDAGHSAISHNLWANPNDMDAMVREFEGNYQYLAQRKNGNAMYHEIIVLPPHVEHHQAKPILLDLAHAYLQKRAPSQLAFGRIHTDRDHPHIHLIISSNAAKSRKRESLSKAEFAEIQAEVERYKLENYPELTEQFYQPKNTQEQRRERQNPKLKKSHRERSSEIRTKVPSKRQQVRDKFEDLLNRSQTISELMQQLRGAGLELYRRGKSDGLLDARSGRKYRLKTLGLADTFSDFQKQSHEQMQREAELAAVRELQGASRDQISPYQER